MATLGHELLHAVEIAGEPSIVDALTGDAAGRRTFETEAAADAGQRVRRELLKNSTRSANGS